MKSWKPGMVVPKSQFMWGFFVISPDGREVHSGKAWPSAGIAKREMRNQVIRFNKIENKNGRKT